MRKFYVCYRTHLCYGEYLYSNVIITLDENEKANIDTFKIKMDKMGETHKELISWSLIEE